MSSAAFSARSNGSGLDGRSSRNPTNGFENWEGEALPPHGALEPELSGGFLPPAVSRDGSRTTARPASALSDRIVSSSGAARSHRRSTEAKLPQMVGLVQPWDEPEPEPESRSRAASVVHAPGGQELPHVASTESSKLSARPGSVAQSHRSHLLSSTKGPIPREEHYEEPQSQDERAPMNDRASVGAAAEDRSEHGQAEPYGELEESSTEPYEEIPDDGDEDEQELKGGQLQQELEPTSPPVTKSMHGSRAASITGALEREPDGGASWSPRAPSLPSSHRSAAQSSAGVGDGGGGGGRDGGGNRPHAGPVEMQDLPPEALPWSEPPEYPSRPPSTVSIDPTGPLPPPGPPPPLPREFSSQASVRGPSAAPSSRSTHLSPHTNRLPVEIPLLPLRDLAAGNRPMSVAAASEPAPAPVPVPPAVAVAAAAEELQPLLSRECSRTSLRPQSASAVSSRGGSQRAPSSQRPAVEIPNRPQVDPDYLGSPAGTPSGVAPLEPQPGLDSPRVPYSREGSSRRAPSARPLSASSVSSSVAAGRTPFAAKSATDWHSAPIEQLPWSARALADFKTQMKRATFVLSEPGEDPLAARMDAVFAMPPELWPVLPPGALYCLEAFDPRLGFGYLQHCDFPNTKVRVATYFGKWGRHLADYVVSWQPTPRAEAAWQLAADGKQPPLPWEPRQVVAHTTSGEYQYANTRMRFRGPRSTRPDSEMVEWSDAHGVDLPDTKAAHEAAPRNSDKDREAHLIDPPRPNTWGELARRPLISNLRARGGGAYVHHVNYDHSGLRTSCGRRVPAGYFFTLAPNAAAKTPPVPGHASVRSSSVGRSLAGGLRANGEPSSLRVRSVNSPVQALLGTFGDSVGSSRWGALVGGASSVVVGAAVRPSSAGPRRAAAGSGTGAGSPPESGGRLPKLGIAISSVGPTDVGAIQSAWSGQVAGGGGGVLQREVSRVATPTSPTLVTLAPKNRWRTYDVPFNHPIHAARAQELGAEMAAACGRNGVRTFSDAAAVLQVSEQELRLPRPFMPGPVVVPRWDDIPRLYGEHMEAARALMPVTELDNYGSSKLHMLLYHLECAATLEYDRLDAKLLLLPQMARLGKKSAEIDAWLQVIVEHAAYLYDKLEITDRNRWRPPAESRAVATPQQQPGATAMRRSVTFAKAAPLTNPTSSPWAFPDPLVGTSFAGRSALNVAVQQAAPPPAMPLPVQCLSTEEWAAVAKIMDTCRHAVLHDHWVRLRPLMTGSTLQLGSLQDSRAGSMIAASSDAGATVSGEGDRSLPFGAGGGSEAADPYLHHHGAVNRELLDCMQLDLAAQSSPDYVAAPPLPAKLPRHRGYRGEGPLPPELVAEMPTVHRPVRCRGADETPLPPEFEKMDLWNVQSKAEQVDTSRGLDLPHPLDAGALRFSQVSVSRLQAAKGFADSRKAEIRRQMQRARGASVFDDCDVPEYGSDVADDDVASVATSFTINTADGRPRRRRRPSGPIQKVEPVVPGIACQATEVEFPSAEELLELEESKSRMLLEAAESRRMLLNGNGGRTREQILEDALKSAESAIHALKPRPIGATPRSEPDSPTGYTEASADTMDSAWRPFGRNQDTYNSRTAIPPPPRPGAGPEPSKRGPADPAAARNRGGGGSGGGGNENFGKGPEPFSLEKLNAEPSFLSDHEAAPELPKSNASAFGGGASSKGIGGLLDYETAMARRRAIAGAEVAAERSNIVPKSEVLSLFVTYCNLGGHPELIEALQRAVEAPLSTVTVSATAKAVSATSRNATSGRLDVGSEAVRQRIRGTAWLLGVTWRRITNETYTSFLCRVLGWPAELAGSLHRTKATQYIAKALVRGHDFTAVPKAPPRH